MGLDLSKPAVPSVDDATCIGCGQCAEICPDQVVVMRDGRPQVGRGAFVGCIGCGHCMAVCPTGSISVTGRGLLPDDRFELPPAAQRAGAEGLEGLLAARRSIRKFDPRQVDRLLLDRILDMTSMAPMGIPPHEVGVVVFDSRDKVRTFTAESCATFEKVHAFLNPLMLALMRPFVGKNQYELMRDFVRPLLKTLVRQHAAGVDAYAYDAPAAMLFHYTPYGDPADCSIAATYAMLAAESLGLGSCLIGTAVALERDKQLKQKYGIPLGNKLGLLMVLGYPAVEFRHGVRRRLASVRYA